MSDPFLDLVPQYKYKITYAVSGRNCGRVQIGREIH
jgi:hypothetical protein